jgi:transposase
MERKAYPSDVTEDAWAFVAPYLPLMTEDAPQRTHSLREVCNGLRGSVRAGAPWRMMPHDLPPWEALYQQPTAGCRPMYLRPSCMTCVGCCD